MTHIELKLFQFTHPGRGATTTYTKSNSNDYVSIHAPREGCDAPRPSFARPRPGFNSRTPGGVRPQPLNTAAFVRMFQFTHPGRGATRAATSSTSARGSFNSRTPGGVRLDACAYHFRGLTFQFTHPSGRASLYSRFQFTHPGRGATAKDRAVLPDVEVSIHAPREGCDSRGVRGAWPSGGFNSRTPGGVRLADEVASITSPVFQFTHPGRGATDNDHLPVYQYNGFQFTHPGRGATSYYRYAPS